MSRPVSTLTRRILLVNVVVQTAIVVTGGVVRLTGSGLGCPTWPECVEGSYAPTAQQEQGWHSAIEFGNRMLTFVVGVVAIATLVTVLRHRPFRRPLALLAATPLLGTVAQAILGGITVLTGLHPAVVAAHFLLSIALIAASVLLLRRAGEAGDGPAIPLVRPEIRILSRIMLGTILVVIVLGTIVTGSGPHSGDNSSVATDGTPIAEVRFGFDPRTVSWLHADAVLLFLGLAAGMILALRLTDAPARVRRAGWIMLAVTLGQGAIGYVQYFTGLPWVVVAVHLLGACLVWIAVLNLHLSLRSRGDTGTGSNLEELSGAGVARG